jgi:hypothetical protein
MCYALRLSSLTVSLLWIFDWMKYLSAAKFIIVQNNN